MAIANPAHHTAGCRWPKNTTAAQTHANSFEREQ